VSDQAEEVLIGQVSGVHGLKGWLKIHSFTDPRAAVFDYQPWLLGDERKEVTLERGQPNGKTLIALLPGVENVEQARVLVGQDIRVPRAALPETGEGQWYWSDLIGLAVINREGVPLGTVRRMIETGANDVMVLEGDRERLIPFLTGQVIEQVDLEAGQILVDWHPED
jgi:16S rRNA processing protein RimM